MKKEYIIGIDFGHGETSAAYCKIPENGRMPEEEVKDIEIAKWSDANQYTIPSAIFIPTKNDTKPIKIGGDAFGLDNLGNGKIYVGFKQKPQIPPQNDEEVRAMWEFMKMVNTKILNDKSLPFLKDNYYIYIAKPSSWEKGAKKLFFKLAHEPYYAGLPIEDANAIINESRAAFIYAQRKTTIKIGRKIYEGTVVVDMGSSTVDMTYMSGNSINITMKDQGYNCGAVMIEKSMLEEGKRNYKILASTLLEHPEYEYRLLYEYRNRKEMYFSGKKILPKIRLNECIDPNIDEKIQVTLSDTNIDEYTKEYQKNFRESLNKYKKYLSTELKREVTINFVILTGGASRMPFAKRIISEEWKLDIEKQIYQIEDPSLTVSRGVTEVARLDILSKGTLEDIPGKVDRFLSNDNITNTIIPKFLSIIIEHLKTGCIEIINERKTATLSCLESEVKKYCNQLLNEEREITNFLSDAIEDSSKDIRKDIELLVSYYTGLGLEMGGLTENIKIQISQFNSDLLKEIEKISEEIMVTIGEAINEPGILTKIWRFFFETREKKDEREKKERLHNRQIGGLYSLSNEKIADFIKKNLIQKINKLDVAKEKYPITEDTIESVKKYADRYIRQLINNIDRVRREITDN